ncbi:MAG: alkyl hydroperoxide reductase [Marine Group III euryarchaeote CG-Epi5]|uniref:Alkyl hydroperoxide reductase n=1 Tax=Marine Group III euryarchaeote CG-Epi5 TaxID=1888999 RepID=A0A1J5U141_9ARCH|nr:MAG: alkyl hydroperoxide reductase [Marine Group III euryarchaeote CG-Epi5]
MALTESTMVSLGSKAPYFSLPDTDGNNLSIENFSKEILVVIFTCNHCPYAKAVEDRLIKLANKYNSKVDFVLISSNDTENYPEDSPEKMAELAESKSYPFPYLFDETQEIAKAYSAVCTPDIFLYNNDRELEYRGRLDDNWKEPEKVSREELKMAIEIVLKGEEIDFTQIPSMGCNIKWKN